DLGKKYDVDSIKLLQREDNPVSTAGTRYSTRIREYQGFAGNDAATLGTASASPGASGQLLNQRGVQRIRGGAKAGRYLKLRVASNYNGGHGQDGVVKISGIDVLGTAP